MYGSPSSPAQPVQHDGQSLPPDDDYPVAPDGAIGRVISSASNRTRSGWKPMGAQEKALFVIFPLLVFLLGGIVGLVAGQEGVRAVAMQGLPQVMELETPIMVLVGLAGAVVPSVVLIAGMWLLRKARVSWVGTDGAQLWEKGLFGSKSTVLRFSEAGWLTTERVRQYVNGNYSGTRYNFTWWSPQRAKVFVLGGSFRETGLALFGKDLPPAGHDPIRFAEAAERAWSRHKIARLDQEIRTTGVATFQHGSTTLRLGRGFVEVATGGKSERIERAQIASATIQQGVIVLKRQGATEGWFSSEGVYKLPVSGMPDFMVFVMLFEDLLGLRFS